MKALAIALLALSGGALASDAIETPLTPAAADPARGLNIVADRQLGLCVLCHAGPFGDARFQGNLAPDLAGVGARLTASQIRARIVDPARANPQTIMPAYYRTEGLQRVAPALRGRTVFSAQQVEDVVSYLATLK